MNFLDQITLRPFQPADQPAAKALILAGLVDHWGFLDPTKNPDLTDISSTYANVVFLVGCLGNELVATGALVPRGEGCAEIVRMSVDRRYRGQGLGKYVLTRLMEYAREIGYRKIVLETTETWEEVVSFYRHYGFKETHHLDGDIYFEMMLNGSSFEQNSPRGGAV
jgi:GNAT superfamily N-acetyltransferase